eukprot:TRINITY_DN5531_c0_g1_i2.p1 TRINITY_DN5531_c0_g1~~TRINITY_DN5531_c0_g1_i2.p1  ORF type:complete len:357 (-),score=51.06 TRINITY_DN5531_c0_g1_i2:227-1297(-)
MNPWAAYYGAPPAGYPPGYPLPAYPPHPGYAYPPPGMAAPPGAPAGTTGDGRDKKRGGDRRGRHDDDDDKGSGIGSRKDRDPDVHTALQLQMKKTKMCSFWEAGKCQRGDKCTFAHGRNELSDAPDLTKTAICQKFKRGECRLRSEVCQFAHGEHEIRVIDKVLVKTKICQAWIKSRCDQGDQCKFAHGKSELKELPGNVKIAPPAKKGRPPKDEDRRPPKISYSDVETSSDSGGSGSEDSRRSGRARRKRPRHDYGPGTWTRRLCEVCSTTVATRFGHESCAVCRQNRLIDDNYQPDAPPTAAAASSAAAAAVADAKPSAAPAVADADEAPRSPAKRSKSRSPGASSENSVDYQS